MEPVGSTQTTPPSPESPGRGPLHGEQPGESIGPYRLLEVIGEGGFGVVYLAERRHPIVQRVALKILKPGMDSREVLARFEQERQALAVMNHPNVAGVLDAGTTPRGLPYFVMEHVQGEPITAYCDRQKLTIKDRLDLFIPVCEAVQHAHHKGIIHRDIKPSNILVAMHEGRAVPKVIDFGVAKAVSHTLTEKTIFTEQGRLIGTPEYMSPEQAEMGATDVDTRTDVYWLGVVLYELLAGVLPFDRATLRGKGYAEIQRIIREVDPPKPSTRLSALHGDSGTRPESAGDEPGASATGRGGQIASAAEGSTGSDGHNVPLPAVPTRPTAHSIAHSRRTAFHDLARELRRELDWIPLKAIRKDRSERYATPMGLAKDIQRYLAGEPLEAGPESPAYRLRKLIKRNRGPVAAAALIVLALAAGLAATLWQARRADERARAALRAESEQRRLVESERAARTQAQEQRAAAEASARAEKDRADELRQVSEFQATMLAQVDPTEAGRLLGRDIIAKFEVALTRSGVPEADRHAQVQAFRSQWGYINATDAARDLIDRTILKPAIDAIDKRFKDQPLVDAQLRQALADLYEDLGFYDAALSLQTRALESRRRVLGNEHPATLESINGMGKVLEACGRFPEAESFYREAFETRTRVFGEGDQETLVSLGNIGSALRSQAKLAEAESCWLRALEGFRHVLGDDSPYTLKMLSNMGFLLRQQRRFAEAERLHREALDGRRRVLGDEHPDTLASMNNMGGLLLEMGESSEAETIWREALELTRRVRGEDHPETLGLLGNMGGALEAQRKYAEAEPLRRECMEKRRRVLGEDHPSTLVAVNNMGGVLFFLGRYSEAEPYLQEALDKRRRLLGDDHPETIAALSNLGSLYLRQGKVELVEPLLREALETQERVLEKDDWSIGNTRWGLGAVLRDLGRYAESEPLLIEAERALRTAPGAPAAYHGQCTKTLVGLYESWEKAEPGKGYDAKAAEWRTKLEALPK